MNEYAEPFLEAKEEATTTNVSPLTLTVITFWGKPPTARILHSMKVKAIWYPIDVNWLCQYAKWCWSCDDFLIQRFVHSKLISKKEWCCHRVLVTSSDKLRLYYGPKVTFWDRTWLTWLSLREYGFDEFEFFNLHEWRTVCHEHLLVYEHLWVAVCNVIASRMTRPIWYCTPPGRVVRARLGPQQHAARTSRLTWPHGSNGYNTKFTSMYARLSMTVIRMRMDSSGVW